VIIGFDGGSHGGPENRFPLFRAMLCVMMRHGFDAGK